MLFTKSEASIVSVLLMTLSSVSVSKVINGAESLLANSIIPDSFFLSSILAIVLIWLFSSKKNDCLVK